MREYLVVLCKLDSIRLWRAVDSCIRHGRKGKGAPHHGDPKEVRSRIVDSLDIIHECVISKWLLVFRTSY